MGKRGSGRAKRERAERRNFGGGERGEVLLVLSGVGRMARQGICRRDVKLAERFIEFQGL
jgi:hypothetical protein